MQLVPYNNYELHLLFSDVRSISSNPYKLHAAFLLSCLFEAYTPNEDENGNEEKIIPEKTWGWHIPKTIQNAIVRNANEQFLAAINEGGRVDVWGNGYTIRKINKIDTSNFDKIFNFNEDGDDYIVEKTGIVNIAGDPAIDAYEENSRDFSTNRIYLRKVIMLAEDDTHNGWDQLTDMEITMYLWAIYFRKYGDEKYGVFRSKMDKELYTSIAEDKECWVGLAQLKDKPHGLYTFSAAKIAIWNKRHAQKSIINSIDDKDAENYWYNVASRKSCKLGIRNVSA